MGNISDKVGQAKIWWQSKTIIGTLLMIIPMVIGLVAPEAGVDVGGAVDTAWEGAEGLAVYADSIWANVQEAIGFALAIYGRLSANVGIKSKVI